ncbi:MAG: hypothetical protein PVJ04_00960 [Gemmatimonadota bacterium]
MTPFRRLLGELHRRAVWQTLGVYLAGSWGALQVIDILANSLEFPRWIPVGAILLILAGLPVTLITAFFQAGRSGAQEVEAGPDPSTPVDKSDPDSHRESGEPSAARMIFTWRHAVVSGAVAFALWGVVGAGWFLLAGRSEAGATEEGMRLDTEVVAVFPFRVSGAGDLDFLREGMVDLLAAKLTGEGGLRAADPRSVMGVWNQAAPTEGAGLRPEVAARLGQSLGAGQVLLGGIVGTPTGLVINASVIRAKDGVLRAQASVEGPLDGLTSLIDQLAGQLLALEAGEDDQRMSVLSSTSLPALRAYLDGQAAYRQGSYLTADQHFERALESDSTFALAALAWVSSAWWSPGFEKFNRARQTAWALRDRLSPRDRTLLEAWAGPRYPETSGWAEHLRMWELAIEAAPEQPEPWYESGDIYFHYGSLLGVTDPLDRAEARFLRASELDPTFAAPVGHLLELAAIRGDTAGIRSFREAYAAVDSAGETASYVEWRAAIALGDEAGLEAIHETYPRMDGASLNRIMGIAQLYDTTLAEAEIAASFLTHRTGTTTERREWLLGLHSLALNGRRPQEALRLIQDWTEVEESPGESLRILLLDALYWDGDRGAAEQAVGLLESRADAPLAPAGGPREAQLADICVVEQWRLWHGDTSTARISLGRFRDLAARTAPESVSLRQEVCAATMEALLARAEGRSDAEDAIQRLEELLFLVPNVETGDDPSLVGSFIVADWREAQGDIPGALAAMRQWHNHWFTGVRYLSTYLREEGRLADLAGEQEEAIQAYRHYLMLRSDPEPEWIAERDSSRARLSLMAGQDPPG